MRNRIKLCENCGGRIELPHRWGRMLVCGPCHLQLSQPSPADRNSGSASFWSSLFGAAVVLVAAGTLAVAMVRARNRHAVSITPLVNQSSAEPLTVAAHLPAFSSPEFVPPVIDEPSTSLETQPTTTEATANGTVGGWIWLARRGGGSEAQRSVRVQLMRMTVRRTAYQRCLADQGRIWQELVTSYTTLAQALRQAQADPNADNDAADQAQAVADEANASLLDVQAAIVAAPRELDTLSALRLLTDLAPFRLPEFDDAVADGTLMETVTDGRGGYLFENVPAGDYYLHASVGSGATLTEWCAPVHVAGDGEAIRLDLSNTNAVVIRLAR